MWLWGIPVHRADAKALVALAPAHRDAIAPSWPKRRKDSPWSAGVLLRDWATGAIVRRACIVQGKDPYGAPGRNVLRATPRTGFERLAAWIPLDGPGRGGTALAAGAMPATCYAAWMGSVSPRRQGAPRTSSVSADGRFENSRFENSVMTTRRAA
jgi:hypothetical protein